MPSSGTRPTTHWQNLNASEQLQSFSDLLLKGLRPLSLACLLSLRPPSLTVASAQVGTHPCSSLLLPQRRRLWRSGHVVCSCEMWFLSMAGFNPVPSQRLPHGLWPGDPLQHIPQCRRGAGTEPHPPPSPGHWPPCSGMDYAELYLWASGHRLLILCLIKAVCH